jgi:selenide,water dikinase
MQGRDDIRLTALTTSGGNAAKLGPANLMQALQPSAQQVAPSLSNGSQVRERAAIATLTETLAMIQVVDFFPPVVDDPFTYGAIAAANAMSNVYALGGEVTMGINVAAWPSNLPTEILGQIFAGGVAKMAEVGALVAGGQAVTADGPLYGLSITGTVDPARILTKAGARVGDRLYLTKAIGTGIVLTAIQREAAKEDHVAETTAAMLRLNRVAAQLAQEVGVSACSDIGGFGLLGHALEIAVQSNAQLQIALEAVPFLSGALEYAELGFVPAEIEQSRNYFATHNEHRVILPTDLRQSLANLLHDPQTSGGLLLSLPATRATAIEAAFAREKAPLWPIGEVVEGSGVEVVE